MAERFEDVLRDLTEVSEVSDLDVLLKMLDSDNISLKTEINAPLHFTLLKTYADYIENNKNSPHELLRKFISNYEVTMVSNKRKSREEIITALTARGREDEEKNIVDKIKGMLK